MIQGLESKYRFIQRRLAICWAVLTCLILSIVGYYQYQTWSVEKEAEIDTAMTAVAIRLDETLQQILKTNYVLKIPNVVQDCAQEVLPQLQQLVFYYSEISAIELNDKNDSILCSTIPSEKTLPASTQSFPRILGPLHEIKEDRAVFLIQSKIGAYYLGTYIIKNVLTQVLQANSSFIYSVHLINADQKTLFETKNVAEQFAGYSYKEYKSHIIPGLKIRFITYPQVLDWQFLANSLFTLLLLLLGSLLLFAYIKSILMQHFSLKNALELALINSEFQPVYQPIWDNVNECFLGAEVLMRWQSGEDEIIYPDAFIHEAEESGLIVPMTLQLMEKVFKDCGALLKNNHYYLSFNLSYKHFIDKHFFDQLESLRERYAIPCAQLVFELTERELFEVDNMQLVVQLQQLTKKGYQLAIDDFGTGHASISYLQHFPFKYLKIDKIFIQAIGTGAITETLTFAIIQLAAALQLKVVAEGIETEQQYTYLEEQGVSLMQGWYFAKPLSKDSFLQLMIVSYKRLNKKAE